MVRTAALVAAAAATPTLAQEAPSLSLEKAVGLFVSSSVELGLVRSKLRAELGDARQSQAISNPTLSITNEDLGLYSERYFNLTQPVDFLWQRGARNRGADARASGARSAFQADSARIVLEMKQTFLTAWEQAQVVTALSEVTQVIEDLVHDAAARLALGDLAAYDLRRLRVAGATVGQRLTQAELLLADAERRLGSLIAGDGSISRVRALSPTMDVPRIPPDVAAVEHAIAHRPELDGARAQTEALDAEASLVARSRLEGVGLTGGFKQQSDGREGLFLGLQFSIPLLDRRGGATQAARAEIDRARSGFDLVRISIARDAALAEARLRAASRQRVLLGTRGIGDARQLLTIARIAYDEGEVGIVELLDAADAFLEARLLENNIRTEEWRAFFQFEHAIGGLPAVTGAER